MKANIGHATDRCYYIASVIIQKNENKDVQNPLIKNVIPYQSCCNSKNNVDKRQRDVPRDRAFETVDDAEMLELKGERKTSH